MKSGRLTSLWEASDQLRRAEVDEAVWCEAYSFAIARTSSRSCCELSDVGDGESTVG